MQFTTLFPIYNRLGNHWKRFAFILLGTETEKHPSVMIDGKSDGEFSDWAAPLIRVFPHA